MAHYETIEQVGQPMRVCLSLPSGGGAHPAIIVMCHGAGLNAFGVDVCDRLAETGFVTAAPDVFHRQQSVTDSAVKRANMIDPERIGILGHYMGGRMSLPGACADRSIQACVNYYGGNYMFSWISDHPTPFERIGDIHCPVLGLFENEDENPSPDDVDRISDEMTRSDISHEIHRYGDAGHAFQKFLSDTAPNPARTPGTRL